MEVSRVLDRGAFDARYPELLSDLRRVCRAVGAGMDAEDIAQDVLLYGRSRLDELRDDRKLVPWLRRIAVRRVARHGKSSGRANDQREAGAGDIERANLAMDERAALARLGRRQRDLVELVYFNGYRQDEAAEMLGISRGNVARTLWDARKVLAIALADYADGDAAK